MAESKNNEDQVDKIVDEVIAEWFVWAQEMGVPWKILGIQQEPSEDAIARAKAMLIVKEV